MELLLWLARTQIIKIRARLKSRITSSLTCKSHSKIICSVRIGNRLICFRLNLVLPKLCKMAVNKMRRIFLWHRRSRVWSLKIPMTRKKDHKMMKLWIRLSMLSDQTQKSNKWNTRIRLNFAKNYKCPWRNSKMGYLCLVRKSMSRWKHYRISLVIFTSTFELIQQRLSFIKLPW